MPSKNSVKTYVIDGYYHIYNRGVEKRVIFKNETDCKMFLYYLKLYLTPLEELKRLIELSPMNIKIQRFLPLNLSSEVDLLAYSLMPNHFHLFIKQRSRDGIIRLMRRLSTSYVMYFNTKYKRVGALFQGKYKACQIETDSYLLHLSRYIHLNPRYHLSDTFHNNFTSYQYYLGASQASWMKSQEILQHFSNKDSKGLTYENFVEDYLDDSADILGDLILERSDLT